MIRSLWISKTGMEAQQTQLDTIANNLANASTNGYKRSHAVFEDLIYQNLRQAGANSSEQTTLPTGLQLGLGSRAVATARNFSQGNLQQTTNSLDVAIKGHGYAVAPGIQVPATAQSITIGNDGTVSVALPGQTQPQVVGRLLTASFVNPAGLEPRGQNLYAETAASGTPNTGEPGSNGLGQLQQGFVETSNVNVVEELVAMIQTQRAYEMNSKAIQTSDQMLQRLSQL
jgi:flagellar basal-body rod protein FlgG